MPGVLDVVVDGRFIAVVASSEREAHLALEPLRSDAVWTEEATLPDPSALASFLVEAPASTTIVHQSGTMSRSTAGATQHEADYFKPYIAHASIGPSCAIARWQDGRLELWTHSQGIQNLRDDLVLALRNEARPPAREEIDIHHAEGAGCYGHNGADDAAFDAVLLALRMPGSPVRVQWSRADELAWSPVGSAQRVKLQAVTGPDGRWSGGTRCGPTAPRPGPAGLRRRRSSRQAIAPMEARRCWR